MSKKLLSEAQIRRFQGLANITPLQEMGHPAKREDEVEEAYHAKKDDMEEGVYKKEDDLDEAMHEEEPKEGMHEEEEDKMEEKMDMDDEDMDDDDDQVEVEEEMVEKAAAALSDLQALVDALGGAADMPDMDDDAGEDKMPMPGADEPEEDEAAMLELALEGIDYQASKKEIVQEVAKRVAKRLVEAKKAHAKLNKALGNK
jgi:hypothetical protein